MARCEICDRDAETGWQVGHIPALGIYGADDFPLRFDAPGRLMIAHTITTCGGDICIFRARHHGVPGASYARSGN